MVNLNIFKLHFTTPLHIGDSRDDYSISLKTIQSDTMYAAIISCLAKLGVEIPDNGDLGCTISSLFPFYQKDENAVPVYFFPKPLKQALPKLENVDHAKKIKKVAWLDKAYFERVLSGETLFEDETSINDIKNNYLTNQLIDDAFIVSQVSPRVLVSRNGMEDAKPFYMDRVYFKDYSGLYFISEGDSALLERGLSLLQDEGIGTDRNVGNGRFVYQKEAISLKLPEACHTAMSLSMFIPGDKEQLISMISQKDKVAYDFTRRGGWITTPPYNTYRKNTVHAFLPASVFSLQIEGVYVMGDFVILTPEVKNVHFPHIIRRNGKSIFIPIKI